MKEERWSRASKGEDGEKTEERIMDEEKDEDDCGMEGQENMKEM